MITVNLREVRKIVKALHETKRSVLLLGSPGIGKSKIFEDISNELNIGCKVIEASSLDPTDVRGIPYVSKGESFYGKPALLPKKEEGERGLLVIDELASCMPAVQVSLYSLFLERRMGDYKLPVGWVPMGTGNYTTDGAVAYALSTALTDRVYMLNVEPDFEVWKEDFAIPRDIDKKIISFLNFKKENFYTFAKRDKQSKGKAFASPRSWEMASAVLGTNLEDNGLSAVLAGCLGEGVTMEFLSFLKVWKNLPNINDIYFGKLKNFQKTTEPSVMYALSGALTGGLRHLPSELSLAIALENMIKFITDNLPAEFNVLVGQELYTDKNSKQYKNIFQGTEYHKKWKEKFVRFIKPLDK